MRQIRNIHFIGIGGVGMAGIAEILIQEGYQVTGSDIQLNTMTERLTELGAEIYEGHHLRGLSRADVVVLSSAIPEDNPERCAAEAKGIPMVQRAEMLAELMRFRQGIAVSGTHGKTTTTSLIAVLLAEADQDPTFVIGGVLKSIGSNARLGMGDYLVAEADESDASFLALHPIMAVVTNIDADHMGQYNEDMNCLRQHFYEFLLHLPFYGLAVVCMEDSNVQEMIHTLPRTISTYGFDSAADVFATDFVQKGQVSEFVVHRKGLDPLPVVLNMPGRHNVLNALAAIAIVTECGVSDAVIQQGLMKFEGVKRRLQSHGEFKIQNGRLMVLDDYGHHPKELAATLNSIREAWPNRRIVLIFQPHRYSRTKALFEAFVDILLLFDQVLLMDVYAAGESDSLGGTTVELVQAIQKKKAAIQSSKVSVALEQLVHVQDQAHILETLSETLMDNDILLFQGAGSVGKLVNKVLNQDSLFEKIH